MKIRSITCFIHPRAPLDVEAINHAGNLLSAARDAFKELGYDVQTIRLATVPFSKIMQEISFEHAIRLAQEIEQSAKSVGVDYVSLGPALPQVPQSYAFIPEMLAATQSLFLSGVICSKEEGISVFAIDQCAQVIRRVANLSNDGFTNLRFAALANVPPDSPYFPAAYHHQDEIVFALATEAADLAVEAFGSARDLTEAQKNLVASIESHAQALTIAGDEIAKAFQVRFAGIDFSLAPFPEDSRSIGSAIEKLGVPQVGMHGSLIAAALLADALDRARFRRVGFSGLMFPLLEDSTLAKRAAQGKFSINDLLLYSSVCGTGLDTLPLPGDITEGQLASILLDLAALAMRLNKPLTARLMPIPGKIAGEPTDFDFAYFANSCVLPVHAKPLSGLLSWERGRNYVLDINPIREHGQFPKE